MKALLSVLTGFALFLPLVSIAAPSVVRITTDAEGRHTLLRNGEPYIARGANWPTVETIDTLVSTGGNSLRTYGDEVKWMLPLARERNLTILFGLHIGRERQGFDYTDQAALDIQFERLRATVRQYKNEPEILAWAIGNEAEHHAKNRKALFREINRIARMIHEEDPNHPVITVVAGFGQDIISELLELCPDLDALGVNWYGPADSWPDDLRAYGWTKPYFHTEFGPYGYWGGVGSPGSTKWGAPIEQTSTEKAALYLQNWRDAVTSRPGQSLGGYAFIWGFKQERTPTWFSMHLFTGERTALVDAMQTAWTGSPPPNPAPDILEWGSNRSLDEYTTSELIPIRLRWRADRPATLTVVTRTETTATQTGGDPEPDVKTLPSTEWRETPEGIEVRAPAEPGNYRIFVQVTTADRTAATANLPIRVRSPGK